MRQPFQSIRGKLFASFFLFIAIVVINYLIYSLLLHRYETYKRFGFEINNLHLKTNRALRIHEDYTSLDRISAQFFDIGNDTKTEEFKEKIKQIEQELNSLYFNDITNGDQQSKQLILDLKELIQTYQLTLDQYLKLLYKRGFKDFGLEGDMRLNAHKIEDFSSEFKEDILMLRRHEKDYFLRKDLNYVSQFNVLTASYLDNASFSDSLKNWLSAYQQKFNEVVWLDIELGFSKNNDGYLNQLNRIKDALHIKFDLLTLLHDENLSMRLDRLKKQFIGLSLLMVLGLIFLAFVLSKGFSKPIEYVSGTVRAIKAEDLSKEVKLTNISNIQEMKQLTSSFNALFGLVRESFVKLDQKSKELNEQNEALYAAQLKLKEDAYLKDRFFTVFANDLKIPIAAMLPYFRHLDSDSNEISANELREIAGVLNDSVENILFTLENLVEWSKKKNGKKNFEPTDINLRLLVDENIKNLEQNLARKNLQIFNHVEADAIAFADNRLIESVIRNLLSNAIKYSNEYGRIWISAKKGGQHWTLSIKDEGIGMSAEDLGKLFKQEIIHSTYGTKNEKGAGLGLLLSKEFVELNKGKFQIDSEKGEGTIVSFTLLLSSIETPKLVKLSA